MHTKTVVVSYAIIGTAVAASFIFNKKLERDIKLANLKMEMDRIHMQEAITNLGK